MDQLRKNLSELYRKFYPFVYSRALFFHKNRHDAEDSAQEVFIRIARGLKKNPDLVTSKSALMRITTHVCIDKYRSAHSRREQASDEMNGYADLKTETDSTTHIYVDQIMGSLTGKQRELALYHFVDGLSNKELASIMGISTKTVARRLKKIKKKVSPLR